MIKLMACSYSYKEGPQQLKCLFLSSFLHPIRINKLAGKDILKLTERLLVSLVVAIKMVVLGKAGPIQAETDYDQVCKKQETTM